MKRSYILLLSSAFLAGVLAAAMSAQDNFASVKAAQVEAWTLFLEQSFPIGTEEREVDKLLAPHSTAVLRVNVGGGTRIFEKYYLIDDFIQIGASFDESSKLRGIPAVENRGRWLRFPDGQGVDLNAGKPMPQEFDRFLDEESRKFD